MASTMITAARGAILLLSLVVFLGHIMMWIIRPTDTYYNHWRPHILTHTNSTFFGIQGSVMLNFTFPILFISVLGCLYLHLGTRNVTKSKGGSRFRFLQRPMIVKGVGIVTATELTLFALFIALCVWYFAYYVHHFFKQAPMLLTMRSHHEKLWQTKLDRVGLVAGLTGNLCLAFLFYPVTRGSSILGMLGLTSEASIKYHIWLGHMTMAFFTAHGFLYILYWALTGRLSEMIKWDDHYVSNIAGEISLLCGLALWITTYPNIRRKMFELFLYTHYLYILFIVFFVFHIGIGFTCIMLPGFYLFIIDRYLRFLQSRQNVRLVSARILPCEAMELTFAKSRELKYNPTSSIFLNIPAVSKLQWHPFTVTSNSSLEQERLSVLIKSDGDWTKKVYNAISSPSSVNLLRVSVEGPYGPATTNFLRHDTLVMVSGGSGIAPFISIIRELIFISSTQNRKTPKIMLVSVFKNSSHLSMLDLILPSSHSTPFSLDLQLEAHVTREKSSPKDTLASTREVRFASNDDGPIYPTLGPNSWLWLCVIISSSFVVFLVFFGVFIRYSVYPVDRNRLGNTEYSIAAKAAMSMFLICFSVAAAASGGFLWNKKRNEREEKTVFEGVVDVELEGFPMHYVAKYVNVHYGGRPNLKRILSEMEESSVGVLVSGPKTMRRDVAEICSNGPGPTGNLHFESISFTW